MGPDHRNETQDELDAIVGSASERIAHELEEPIKIPTFSSVVARAQRMDPKQVEPSLLRGAWASEARASCGTEVAGADSLATFVRAARVEAEADVRDHLAEIGDPEPTATLLSPKTQRGRWAVVAAAAAAVIFVVVKGLSGSAAVTRTNDEHSFYQSVVEHRSAKHITEVESPAPTRNLHSRPASPRFSVPPSEDAGSDDLICHDDPGLEQEMVPEVVVPEVVPDVPDVVPDVPKSTPNGEEPRRKTLRDALRELDDRAENALAHGDLAAADELFRELIRRGGRSRRVERAYGDRFMIARRLRNPAARVELWREYLREFPRGRFAEDALAGLCQEEQRRQTNASCWRTLLERFPQGVYANQAQRALTAANEASDEGAL
ncbi:MAG: tetratricopeptide repeat protein [Nannocystaceae bacterium]